MKLNYIIKGDTLMELKKLPSESVDLIFADPPYWMRTEGTLERVEGTKYDGVEDHWDQFEDNGDYNKFTKKWLTECKRVLKQNGSIWVIGGMQCIYSIGGIMQDLNFWFINDVVWYKKNPTPNFKGTRLNNSHETLIWATKSKKSKFTFNYKTAKELNTDSVSEEEFRNGVRKQMKSVWNIALSTGNERLKDDSGNKLHSTQKPIELLYRIIAISSSLNDIVLDPFGGTMTTGAVAKMMGRNYIMIEREEKYVKYGQRRLDSILPLITDIETAKFDVKQERAKMEDMIRAGFFIVGEWFFTNKDEPYAQLTENGKLKYNDTIYDIHTLGGIARGRNNRINGFDYWKVLREGKLLSIDVIRGLYRNRNNLDENN